MIRAGLGIIVLGILLFGIEAALMDDTPPGAGANIGAGLLTLVNIGLLAIGGVLTVIGLARWLVHRKRSLPAR